MTIIALIGAFLIALAIFLLTRLYPYSKTKLPATPKPDHTRHTNPDHYKIIEKEGKQVGVKFDDAGHRKYFFNNN